MQDLWKWVSSDFLSIIKPKSSNFNASIRDTYANFDAYINDTASVLVGYPIMRQLRIRKGIQCSVFTRSVNLTQANDLCFSVFEKLVKKIDY